MTRRAIKRWFPWLPKDAQWTDEPILAYCGNSKCKVCQTLPHTTLDATSPAPGSPTGKATTETLKH